MTDAQLLPAGFEVLEPFLDRWSIAGTASRAAARTNSTPEDREAFFLAASPLLDQMLSHLDGYSLDALPPAEERLMNLALTLGHVAIAVEIQGPDEPKLAPWRERMVINRAPAGV